MRNVRVLLAAFSLCWLAVWVSTSSTGAEFEQFVSSTKETGTLTAAVTKISVEAGSSKAIRHIIAAGPTNTTGTAIFLLLLLALFWKSRKTSLVQQHSATSEIRVKAGTSEYYEFGGQLAGTAAEYYSLLPNRVLRHALDKGLASLSTEEHFNMMVEASLRTDRKAGLLLLPLQANCANGVSSDREIAEYIVHSLKQKIDQDVHVYANERNEIVFLQSGFVTSAELAISAANMHAVAAEAACQVNATITHYPGAAMYPLDGYELSDLVAFARIKAIVLRGTPTTIAREFHNPQTSFHHQVLNAPLDCAA